MATSLQALKQLGAHDLLRRAAQVIEARGLARGVTHDRISRTISCSGAVYVACGARLQKIPIIADGPESAGVPVKNQILADEIITYLESFIGADDLEEWSDAATQSECITTLRNAAQRLVIVGN